MLNGLRKITAAGTSAIALSGSIASGGSAEMVSLTVHLSTAAPTSAGSLTVTLNAHAGSTYDTVLSSVSMVGVTDLLYRPTAPVYLEGSDAIDVAYTNPDARTYGAQLTVRDL